MNKVRQIGLSKKYLRQFGYKTTDRGLDAIWNEWLRNKGSLLEMFRKHPNWNEDALAIIMPQTEFETCFSNKGIYDFNNWFNENMSDFKDTKSVEDMDSSVFINKLDDIRVMIRYSEKNNKTVTIDGRDVEDIKVEINAEFDEFKSRVLENMVRISHQGDKAKYITKELNQKIDKVYTCLRYLADYAKDRNITKEQADRINDYIEIGATEGQKLSRVINKLANEIGLVNYRKMEKRENPDGTETEFDNGYQRQFNILAEYITPHPYKRNVVISLNPLDYWGMSIMDGTTSCMSIDKYNLRRIQSRHEYSGAYSGGTESYMLDKCTFVFYTVTKDYDGEDWFRQDKKERCIFCVNANGTYILQSRVYPDGRDGGDPTKANQYRAIVQKVIADIYGYENLWTFRISGNAYSDVSRTQGQHYADYQGGSDCSVSKLQTTEINTVTERPIMMIGHKTMCPVCGCLHDRSENIICRDCERDNFSRDFAEPFDNVIDDVDESVITELIVNSTDVVVDEDIVCEQCGEHLNGSDSFIEIDGHIFCDEDCAEEFGYHRVRNHDGWYHEDNDDIHEDYEDGFWFMEDEGFNDSYNGEWYYGDPEIETEDGNCYYSEEHAENDDYRCDNEGCWRHLDDLVWSVSLCEYVYTANCINTEDGEYFGDGEDARNAGYESDYEGRWYKLDEMMYDEYEGEYFMPDDAEVVTEDGICYLTEDSAKDAGYVELENGSWILQDDAIWDDFSHVWFTESDAEVCTEDGNYFLYESSAIIAGYRETENGWVKIERESA